MSAQFLSNTLMVSSSDPHLLSIQTPTTIGPHSVSPLASNQLINDPLGGVNGQILALGPVSFVESASSNPLGNLYKQFHWLNQKVGQHVEPCRGTRFLLSSVLVPPSSSSAWERRVSLNTMSVNCFITPVDGNAVTSNGIWSGSSPLAFSLPLLSVQLLLVVAVTRILHFLLKPFKQPRIVSEIMVPFHDHNFFFFGWILTFIYKLPTM